MAQYDEANFKVNRPAADVLMPSMRSMGYTFESAVADIIDNSISAQASEVYIEFPLDPSDIYLAICDNGTGMDGDELFDAMKYGSEMKRAGRAEDDLGKFGLGLKAASLSQCRKLTVVSKKNGKLSACVWDLNLVEAQHEWIMVSYSEEQIRSIRLPDYLERLESGTVVLWEDFDFLRGESGDEYGALIGKQNSTAEYLSLIFHRYLNRLGAKRLRIQINRFVLKGYDPFLESHPKTTMRKPFTLSVNDSKGIARLVRVQPYILPYLKDLTKEDAKQSGGIENYMSKQGFYIYRNERLIVWGTWFRRRGDELTKYARIKVDIPNTLDEIWSIDIKKQCATIPSSIQQQLKRAVDDAMDVSSNKQKYRGRLTKTDEKIDYIWNRIENRGTISYSINTKSKIFDLIREKADDELWGLFEMAMEEVQSAVPFQQIYIDRTQNKIEDDPEDERKTATENYARMLVSSWRRDNAGCDIDGYVDELMRSEPFSKYPGLRELLLEDNND